MDEEGRYPCQGMETPRQHRHRIELLGCQGPWSRWNPPSENSRTSSKKRKSWWKTCNFPKLCVSILQILSEEDHLIIIHFVVEVLVSTHLFFNLIALINLLSMDIDSFLALPHPNQNICMHWSGVYTYHRNYL